MPNFPYNLGIPNGPNNPSNDQPSMKTNTDSIDSIIGIDHFTFETDKDGWHQQSTYPLRIGAPTTTVGQLAVFATNFVDGNASQLCYVRDNIASVFTITGRVDPVRASNGSTALIGNMSLAWGSIVGSPITNGQVVSFPAGLFAAIYSITLGPVSNSTNDKTISITTGSVSTSGFTVSTSGSSLFQTVYWMAIGASA